MLEVRVLGPIVVAVDDRAQAIKSRKVRALLCMLALNAGHAVPTDELIDELWGEDPPAKVRNALQANIVRLRRALAAPHDPLGMQIIQTMNSGYLLDLDGGQVDAIAFQRLAGRGHDEVESTPAQALTLLTQALALWRGHALDDVTEGLCCSAAAVQLDEQRMTVREDVVAVRMILRDERSLVAELRHLVAQYPGRERFSEQLMVALYRCGRQSEAIDVFHRLRGWLSVELGLEPCRSLRGVYQAILVQDPDLGLPVNA
jgi:DNA-binding SARP family transcriptional activator